VKRALFLSAIALSALHFIPGCSSSNETGGVLGYGSYDGPGSSGVGTTGGGPMGGTTGGAEDPNSSGGAAGTLTAADWDDNLNFELYQAYQTDYLKTDSAPFIHSADRIVITVQDATGQALPNAHVEIAGSSGAFLSIPTATDGRALFLPKHDGAPMDEDLKVTVFPPPDQSNVQPVTLSLPISQKEWLIPLPGSTRELPTALDLAFVVDATGSMDDEIQYLKAEIDGIASDVKSAFSNADIRYALIVYRDNGDEYVTRKFEFTSDLAQFQADLNKQSAGGGGDTPEAMDAAMDDMVSLQWRTGNAARLAFLVADAPTQPNGREPFLARANEARLAGIKVYPVAASGVSPDAEFQMRNAAQATLGRYLFLTDDSGVGGSHAEPHIPCYQVQHLNKLINRMIASELKGERIPATSGDILRSVGEPMDGVCTLGDGSKAYL
jgi:hypothetical protein